MKHDPMEPIEGGHMEDIHAHFGTGRSGEPIDVTILRLCRAYIDMARRVESLETSLDRARKDSLEAVLEVKRLNARVTQIAERTSGLTLIGRND